MAEDREIPLPVFSEDTMPPLTAKREIPKIPLPLRSEDVFPPLTELPVQNDTDYTNQRVISNDQAETEKKKVEKEASTVVKSGGQTWWEDIDKGIFDEAIPQAKGGFFDFLNESWKFAGEAADWIDTRLPESIKEASDALRGSELKDSGFGKGKPLPEVEAPTTLTGGFVRGATQFMTGFVPALGQLNKATKGLQAAGLLTKKFPRALALLNNTLAGAAVDAIGFDPQNPNIANLYVHLVGKDGPAAGAMEEYLASNPNDSNAANRLKNALAGGLIGFGIEASTIGLKATAGELFDAIAKQRGSKVFKAKKASVKLDDVLEDTGESVLSGDRLKVVQETLAKDKLKLKTLDDVPFKFEGGQKVLKGVPKDRPGSTERIAKRLREGDLPAASDMVREKTDLNFDRMDTTDDMAKGMQVVSDEMAPLAKDYKRSFKDVEEVAELLGTSMSDVDAMFDASQNFDSRFLAARHMLVESSDLLMNKATAAATGNREAVLDFHKHIARHKGLQHQISGIKTEVARTLNAMKIEAKSGAARFNQIDDMVASLGGADDGALFAARLLKLGNDQGIGAVSRELRKGKFATMRDAGLEMYINGLLSKPKTQITNFMGNMSAISMSVMERAAAARIGTGGVLKGEAASMMHGIRVGFKDAFKLGLKSLKSTSPSDMHVKTDYFKPHASAISGEAFNQSGLTGAALDFIGTTTRVPARMLMAADDFFKAINFNMEKHAQAFRRASQLAGDSADDFSRIYDDIISGGDEGINKASQDFARINTFTNQLDQGSLAKSVQTTIGKDPTGILKAYVPFFQTPVNLLNFVGHRTPGINRLYKSFKADMLSPDPAVRQLAQAKTRVGGAMYVTMVGLASQGAFTGAPPKDRAAAARAKDSGWRPYAIRTKNGYIPYNRFDPIGLQIGLAADFWQAGQSLSQILQDNPLGEEHEEDMWQRYSDVGSSLILSTYHNMADRHYFAGVSEFINAVDGDQSGIESLAKQAINMTPPLSFYSGLRKGVRDAADPIIYDTKDKDFFDEVTNELYNEIPGVVGGNEPQFNLLGEVKTRLAPEGSLAWRSVDSLVNPFQFSERSTNFLENEFRRLGVNSTDMSTVRTIDKVELEPAERTFFAKQWGKLNKDFQRSMNNASYHNLPDGHKKLEIEAALLINRKEAAQDTRDKFPRIEQVQSQQLIDEEQALDNPSRVPSLIQN